MSATPLPGRAGTVRPHRPKDRLATRAPARLAAYSRTRREQLNEGRETETARPLHSNVLSVGPEKASRSLSLERARSGKPDQSNASLERR